VFIEYTTISQYIGPCDLFSSFRSIIFVNKNMVMCVIILVLAYYVDIDLSTFKLSRYVDNSNYLKHSYLCILII